MSYMSRMPKKAELEALPEATAKVSGFTLKELMAGGKHVATRWAYLGIYTGMEMGGSLTGVSKLFDRIPASGFQGVQRVKLGIKSSDSNLKELSDDIRKEAVALAEKRK